MASTALGTACHGGNFVYRRIGDSPGCYSSVAKDPDGDGHRDIVTVSASNQANDTSSVRMAAWPDPGHWLQILRSPCNGSNVQRLLPGAGNQGLTTPFRH